MNPLHSGLSFTVSLALGLTILSSGIQTTLAQERLLNSVSPKSLKPGPWGDVRVVETTIMPPSELIKGNDAPLELIEWFVRAQDRSTIEEMMATCEIGPALRSRWLDHAEHEDGTDAWIIRPEINDVLELPSDVRGQWYDMLTLWTQNKEQRYPFRYIARPDDEWVDISKFSGDVQAQINRFIYRDEDILKFADMGVLPAVLTNQNERIRFQRMIAAKQTLLGALFVDPDDDVDALVEYWGVFGREERIRSIIELASRSRSPWGIPLELMFPPIPRSVIYTYQQGSPTSFDLDCNWTTYNFFREEADYSANTAILRSEQLYANYDPIPALEQFGDVVVFLDRKYRVLHLCNYIADDLVFTKNGYSILQPWILMRLSDVEAFFQSEFQAVKRVYFRYRNKT